MSDVEIWLPIEGFDGYYEVSDRGRVRSIDRIEEVPSRWGGTMMRKKRGTILKPGRKPGGYLFVGLHRDSFAKYETVHCLVAQAFIGPRPTPKHHVAHSDGNQLNNHAGNLRYATCAENAADKVRHGTALRGEMVGTSKLKLDDVIAIRSLRGTLSNREIAKKFGIHEKHVHRIAKGLRWGWVP